MDLEEKNSKSVPCIISASNVPLEFFKNRDIAKKYFRRYGKIKLLMFKPKRNSILVEYTNEDSLLNALELSGEYNGKIFKVTREISEISVKKKRSKKSEDPDWLSDPEVRAELEAMGGLIPVQKTYELRSHDMVVDPVSQEPQVAKIKRSKWKNAGPKLKIKENTSEEDDLKAIIRSQAFSIEDKYKILDARDKLIRLNLKKKVEIIKKSPTIGTCPDMCPEKERLLRVIQHQVALYEQYSDKSGLNPKLAVKQYSRSSADQEAPLPSELRPVNVLQMTMGYLMHRIMDLIDTPDVNIAEWYHFLWDRTRGIRKDITQQELCCSGSVELVEQCARFHIICSARLVAEDPSVFDQKINTENLTKCLQTLKYMYHDLSLKGECCVNEAEFRAYIILLNLNDGNFMWEVQQLKREIQESAEIKFALDIYSALDKNNYVKFFKLVASTTYLNACILMRYFIQVRLSALKTMLKCYAPRTSQTSLHISYLTQILAFENTESAAEFLETYGLYVDKERARVILNKANFSMPEYPFALDRALNLIESKRNKSIGRVVCGAELPEKLYETHQPQDSFDERGYLKFPDLFDDNKSEIEDDNNAEIIDKIEEEKQRIKLEEELKRRKAEEEEIKRKIEERRKQVELEKQILLERQKKLEAEEEERRRLIILQQKREEEERIRKIKEEQEEKTRLLRLKLQREKEEAEAKERRRKKIKEQEEFARIEAEKRRKELELKRDVAATLEFLINSVEIKIKRETLEKIRSNIKNRAIKKICDRWREFARRKRKRKALDFNPFFISNRTREDEANELKTKNQDLTLSSIKRYKLGLPLEIFTDLESELDKINLTALTFKILTKRLLELTRKVPKEIYWKISISLPDESEFRFGLNFLEKILQNYLQWCEKSGQTVLIQQTKTEPCITYCLEKQKGVHSINRYDSNGFIFVADKFNEILCERILHSLQNFGVFTKIPIVLALQKFDDLDRSKLDSLIDQGVISNYLVILSGFNAKDIINMIEESLIFLATRLEKPPPLELDTLKSFLHKHLIGDVFNRANSFAKWNSNYKICLRNPNTVINIYNEALDRLKRLILNRACAEYPKFAEIFRPFLRSNIPDSLPCDYRHFPSYWSNHSYLQRVGDVVESLKLPKFIEDWPIDDRARLEASILRYVKALSCKNHDRIFYKMMSVVLSCNVGSIAWTDVVEAVFSELLEQRDFSLYGTGFVNKSVFNQLTVVYDVTTLSDFLESDWFYVNHPLIKHKMLEMLEEDNVDDDEAMEVIEDKFDLDVDKMLEDLMKTPRKKNVDKIKNEIKSCKSLLNDLEDSIVIHKRILEKSGGILKELVENK